MKMTIGRITRTAMLAVAFMLCATGQAWARMTLLNYMNFDTVDGNAISLQNYGGNIVPVQVDGSTINKADSSKFGANAYKANDGVVGLQNTTDGLVSVADGFTISFWFNPNGQSNWNSFFGFGLLNGDNYYFVKRGDNAFNVYKDTTSTNDSAVGDPVIGGVSYTGGAWNHVAIVCQPGGTSASLYVNGTAYTLSLGDISLTSLREVLLCRGRWHNGADSAFYRNKQTTLFDDFALFSGALTQGEVLVIAGGVAPISAIANSEFPAAVSLEEFGGFVTTEPQLAFKNATLSEITADTLKGRFSGASISAKGKAATFFNFASSDSSTLTCEAQMDGDYDGNNEIFKSVFLTFTQSGDDVYVKANSVTKWMNKGDNPLGTSLADQGTNGSLATSISASGYGIYNLNLPRTYESGATVVWNAGELLIPKFGSDGNKYVVTLPASGMSLDANGNLKVASSGATTGATIDLPDTHIASVLIKYSSLSAVASSKVTLATAQATYNANADLVVVGSRTTANSALTLTGYWDNTTANNYDFNPVPTLTAGSGYFMYSYHNDTCGNGGTYAYAGTSSSTLSGNGTTSLRWTNDNNLIKKLSIGGPITTKSGVVAWPDVAIEKVALFIGSESFYKGSDIVGFSFVTTEATITAAGTYTLSGENPLFETVSADESYVINVNESATLNIPAATTVNKITFNVAEGKTLTLTGGKLTAGAVVVTGDGNLVFDVSGYDCETLARNAVAGAPYRVWPGNFSSATGNMTIDTSSVEVPIGYSYSDVSTVKGPALEFTTTKQFGSLNINFYRSGNDYAGTKISDNASCSGLMHGAFPVVGTSWNDVVASNVSGGSVGKYVRQDGAVVNTGTATITIPSVGGWSTSVSSDQILAGYCDDGQQPEVTINNVPFAKYRVIVYAATDSKDIAFCPKIINGVSYSTAAAGSTATPTIPGGIGAWGNTDASRSTLAEGVNYLVSDVISDTSAVTIKNNKTIVNNRACITAVQIVEVGVDNTYDIDDAGTYDLATIFPSLSDGCAYEINVNESATLNVGSAATAGAVVFNVAVGKTLTISGSTITANSIYVYGKGKVACSAADTLFGTIKGEGRIVYTGTLPDNTLKTSFQNSSNWTGTVEIKDYTQTTLIDSHRIIKLNDYGNVNSAVALNCVTSTMYAVSGTYPAVTLREIEIGEGGWSDTDNNYGASMLYTAKLTGHGPITVKTKGSGTVKFIGEHTFDGSVSFGSNTGKQVAFMRTAEDAIPAVTAKAIVVASGQEMSIASGKAWTAPGGVDVRGSLTVNGTGSISGNVALSSSATLDISGFTGATPAISGTLTLASGTTIKLPSSATFPYKVADSITGSATGVTVKIGETSYTEELWFDNGNLCPKASASFAGGGDGVWSGLVWSVPYADYTKAYCAISVTDSGTINLGTATTGKITINVPSTKTLTLGGTIAASVINFTGGGTVVCNADNTLQGTITGSCTITYPVGTLPADSAIWTNSEWRGTNVLSNCGTGNGYPHGFVHFENYGGVNSFIKTSNFHGYPWVGKTVYDAANPIPFAEATLIVEDSFIINDGASGWASWFAKLSGSGLLSLDGPSANTQYAFGDVSGFNGSVYITNPDGGNKSYVFGAPKSWAFNNDDYHAMLVIAGGNATIAAGKSWSVPAGIVVLDGATLTVNGNISGACTYEGFEMSATPVTLNEGATLDISGYAGETPAIPSTLTLNGGVIKLPEGATLPYRIAASGDGAPSSCTIGDTTRMDLLLKDGELVATRTATISTESVVTFGSIVWTGSGDDYTLTLSAPTYLTFDNTTVDYLKIMVEAGGKLFVNGEMPANTTILGLTPLTIAASGEETFKAGYTRLFSQIGTTENGDGALNATGTISVSSSGDIPAGTYTLARWLKPQKMSSGYGYVASLDTTGLAYGLTAELVYCVDRIVLRVYDTVAQAAKGSIKIWPYGDSITEGFNAGGTKANYRVLLAQKLSLLGYNVEMVGCYDKIDQQNGIDPAGRAIPPAWKWHSAKHGSTAGPTTSAPKRANLCENVDTLCAQAGNPDVVLLLVGANDIVPATKLTAQQVVSSITNIVAHIATNLPDTKIVVGNQLGIEEGYTPGNYNHVVSMIPQVNALLKTYVDNLPTGLASKVFLADLNSYVKSGEYAVLYGGDHLHPDWLGHDQMAEGWLAKIRELYPDSNVTFPSDTPIAAPASHGAANNAEVAEYLRGFRCYGAINIDKNLDPSSYSYSGGDALAAASGIARVGYYVEYVRDDNNASNWVWIDMDAFGPAIADLGLPRANHQQIVNNLHIKSSHNGIDDVAVDDNSVQGWIEFSPYTYGANSSGVTGAPAEDHNDIYGWNDTLASSGSQGTMQVFRKASPNGRPAQTLFAFNNWNQNSTEAEFGIGNFSSHFYRGANDAQTFDYSETRNAEKMNAAAYKVKTIEIWTNPDKLIYSNDNKGGVANGMGSYPANTTWTITMPGESGQVKLDSIVLGTRNDGTDQMPNTYIRIETAGGDVVATSDIINGNGTHRSDTSFAGGYRQTFTFSEDCLLTCGTAYVLKFVNADGSVRTGKIPAILISAGAGDAYSPIKNAINATDWRIAQTIYASKIYEATLASGANTFSGLTFSPDLPPDFSEAHLMVSLPSSTSSTLTFGSSTAVGTIRFNIPSGSTLTIADAANLTAGKIIVYGTGTLKLAGSITTDVEVMDSATIAFGSGESLTITGDLTVASGKTLTLAPSTITSGTAVMLTADSVVGDIAFTAPVEENYGYSMLRSGSTIKIVRMPTNPAFSFNGTIGATPTGWFSSWAGEGFDTYLRVGPNSTMPVVYEVRDGKHPYNDTVAWTDKDITFSIYADISQVSETGKQMLVGVGRTGEVDNRKFLILYREGANVKFGVWDTGKYEDNSDPTHLVGTAATVTAPVSSGYHLYTATFNHATGDVGLYLDNSAAATGSAGGAIAIAQGLQIGSILRGVNNDDWSRCSGNHGLAKGIGMAFAAIRGYDAVLEAEQVAKLAESFPATDGSVSWDVLPNNADNESYTYSLGSATFGDGNMLGISHGTMNILSGATVNVGHFRALNHGDTNDRATVNIAGTLNVTSANTNPNVWAETGKGILLGHWKGEGTYNVTGRLLGENAYLELYYTAGKQTFAIDGGTVRVKGIYARSGFGPADLTLSNGGALEVKEVPTRGTDPGYGEVGVGTVNYNFGYGTYRALGDITHNQAINFTGASAQPTTLDPNGHTLTLAAAAVTGSGYIKIASGTTGTVVFNGGSFTGTVIIDANAATVQGTIPGTLKSGVADNCVCSVTVNATTTYYPTFASAIEAAGENEITVYGYNNETLPDHYRVKDGKLELIPGTIFSVW